jgi:hypothetical protein
MDCVGQLLACTRLHDVAELVGVGVEEGGVGA